MSVAPQCYWVLPEKPYSKIWVFQSLGSSNDYLKNNSLQFSHFDTCLAEEQLAGKGRGERQWHSSRESLTFTTILRNTGEKQHPMALAQCVALAWVQVLQKAGVASSVKWPNDILCKGKKLAGILGETGVDKLGGYLAMGVGLNINQSHTFFKERVDQAATSVFIESGKKADPAGLLGQFLTVFYSMANLVSTEGFEPFYDLWRQNCQSKGRLVILQTGNKREKVKILGLSPEGALWIEKAGRQEYRYSGEILESFEA